MFAIHDTVVYGHDGVCTVTDIAERRFGQTRAEYYVLTPLRGEDAVIYVPTANAALRAKMHRVLSPEELRRLLSERSDGGVRWEQNELLRRQRFRRILQTGDRRELIGLIRLIDRYGKRSKLRRADEQTLRDAEALLYEELSYVLHITHDEVRPLVLGEDG